MDIITAVGGENDSVPVRRPGGFKIGKNIIGHLRQSAVIKIYQIDIALSFFDSHKSDFITFGTPRR